MTTSVSVAFEIVSWQQSTYDEPEAGPEFARADVKKRFRGDIEAESTAVLLLCGSEGIDGAGYVATERIVGRVGNRTGTFVIQHGGNMDSSTQTSFGYVVLGSGTGELQGIRGECRFVHTEDAATFQLDYDLA